MPTNFPAGADSFAEIIPGTFQNELVGTRTHRQNHNDIGDAIEEIEIHLGGGLVTAAAIQDRWDDGYKKVILPAGTHSISTTLEPPAGAGLFGQGQGATALEWTGSGGGIMIEHDSGLTVPALAIAKLTIKDLTLYSPAVAATGIKSIAGGMEIYQNLAFDGVTTPLNLQGGAMPILDNIFCTSAGSNLVGGSIFNRLPHLDINGYRTYGASAQTALMLLTDIAAGSIRGFHFYAPATIGMIFQGDCQGIEVTSGVMALVTSGVLIRAGGGSGGGAAAPQFLDFVQVAIDQPSVAGFRITEGGMTKFVACNVTNTQGSAGAGTASGFIFGDASVCFRNHIDNCEFENLGQVAIDVANAGGQLRVTRSFFIRGGQTPAGDAAVRLGSGAVNDVSIVGNDMVAMTHSIVDQATSGARREYLFNAVTEAPLITTTAGTVVNSATQLQTDAWLIGKQIATPGMNPPTGYDAAYFKADGNLYKLTPAGDEVRILDADVFTTSGAILVGTGAEAWTETTTPTIAGKITATSGLDSNGTVTMRSANVLALQNAANTAAAWLSANTAGDLNVGGTTGALVAAGLLTAAGGITVPTAKTLAVVDADALTIGGVKVGTTIVVNVDLDATLVDKWLFIADRAYEVVSVKEIHSVIGGASSVIRPRKVTDTSAPGAAASATVKELITAPLSLETTINTTQTGTLSATPSDYQLAAGNKIGLDTNGTMTGLVGVMTITLKAL